MLTRFYKAIAIPAALWVGASCGLFATGSTLWALYSYHFFLSQPRWLSTLIGSLLGIGYYSAIALAIVLAVRVAAKLPKLFLWSTVASTYLIVYAFDGISYEEAFGIALYLLPCGALMGGGIGLLWTWNELSHLERTFSSICFFAGLTGAITLSFWFVTEGEQIALPYNAASAHKVAESSLPNPADRGPFRVLKSCYGSGKDRWRAEYSSGAAIVAPPVNGSHFISRWNGWAGWWRSLYWGFTPKEIPRNGLVWYPEGLGPFPLVLIVHGNAMMEARSEQGYSYLAELLASRGYIVVSVDENFFNSSWHSLWQGTTGNNSRAWLLLEHLSLWREWNKERTNPFFQKVDLENIALIGHSRGGEAIALAHSFNKLPYYPENCNISFNYHFNIRSLVAIAPVDGQYELIGRPNELKDVNYLVLHGSSDADVRAFEGSLQFQRVTFSQNSSWLKASVYIYGANHGQFNTVWGRYDQKSLEAWLLNVEPLIKPEEQTQIAKVYISAFLEATLQGKEEYKQLLRDPRWGRSWLPNTVYITQYADGHYQYLADFEKLDPSFWEKQYGTNLRIWRQQKLHRGCTRAVFLGWDRIEGYQMPSYTVETPPLKATTMSSLVFSMADAIDDPSGEGVDLTVEVSDLFGESATLPLSHYSDLQPSLRACIWKIKFLECSAPSDNVYQSFCFPMQDFIDKNPRFNPHYLTKIRWIFDRTPSWEVILDDVAIRPY